MKEKIEKTDHLLINFCQRADPFLARAAIFVVYFWFGLLKVIGMSPASTMVADLQSMTMPFFAPDAFMVVFGLIEMGIGALFLIPRLERVAIPLLIGHMATAFLPLVLLPHLAWQSPFVPTLEGQYILKNIVIIALAFSIAARMTPLCEERMPKEESVK